MSNLENAKIYRRVSNSGTDQYAVVNLDATNFCVTISGSVYGVGDRFEWAVWKRDSQGHVTVATPYNDTDAANKGYVDNNFVNVGNTSQEIGGQKHFSNYLAIYDDGDENESAPRPSNASGFSDPDLYLYSTGFTLLNVDNADYHQYAFPNYNCTLGSEIQIVDLR